MLRYQFRPPSKPCSCELGSVEVDVRLRQPIRQRKLLRGCSQKPSADGNHPDWSIRRSRRRIAGGAEEHQVNRSTRVPLELRFRHARGLEIELIENGIVRLRHHRRGWHRRARPVGHAQADDTSEDVRTKQRRVPCHGGAPVVAGDHGLLFSECFHQTDDIAD